VSKGFFLLSLLHPVLGQHLFLVYTAETIWGCDAMITVHKVPLDKSLPVVLHQCWGDSDDVEASLRLSWEGSFLHLRFLVREPQLRRMVTEHNGRVWEDSCVEAFLARQDSEEYINVECSASTSILLGKGQSRHDRQLFPVSVIENIPYTVEILENNTKQSRWKAELSLDLVQLGVLKEGETLEDVPLKGNFTCCGDKLAKPHYLCAQEIGTLKPDFHTPAYFTPIKCIP
jgi:hypothetical protein